MPTRASEKSIPEPWNSFLSELDAAVDTEVRLDCMGGFVVTLVYGFSRSTGDLDVLEIAPREARRPMLHLGMQGGPLHKKYKIYLDLVGVAHVSDCRHKSEARVRFAKLASNRNKNQYSKSQIADFKMA